MGRRVLILNERDLDHPRAGGAEIHLFEVFGRLAGAGDDVTMLCAGFDGGAPETVIAGVRVLRFGRNRYEYYPRVIAACRRHLRDERPDVLVEAHNKLPFLSPLYTPSTVPRLVIVHHLFGTTAFQQVPFPVALVVVAAERLIPYLYKNVSFVVISESTRRDMIERGVSPGSVRVVPCGVDHTRYRVGDGQRAERPTCAFVGRIETYKRIDVLLRAFRRVRQQGIDAALLIVGVGDALAQMQQLAADLEISAHVEFPGFVSEEEKVRILQRAHVCAQPSEKEGWGLTVIESNACGTPVVAADAPGLQDSVSDGETGLLVPVGDVEALADALVRLLRDDALRERMSRAAVTWAGRFRWDTAAREIGEAIDAVCGRRVETPIGSDELSLSIRSDDRK